MIQIGISKQGHECEICQNISQEKIDILDKEMVNFRKVIKSLKKDQREILE